LKRELLIIFALFLLAGLGFATSLTIIFGSEGSGVIHYITDFVATFNGQPETSAYYWVALSGYSLDVSNAVGVEDANASGNIQFEVLSSSGNCTWYAVISEGVPSISSTKVSASLLDGKPISVDQNVYWSVKPDSIEVTSCSITYDMNVN